MTSRRNFISKLAFALTSAVAATAPAFAFRTTPPEPPIEDLMQEHGVLSRLLLIFEESAKQLSTEKTRTTALETIKTTNDLIIQNFAGHHEKIEEIAIFPVINRSSDTSMKDLVQVLLEQHKVGSSLTERITALYAAPKVDSHALELSELIDSYVRMYRAHASREDTILFPFARRQLNDAQYAELTNKVRNIESHLRSNSELATLLAQIDALETNLGIHNLAHYTASINAV